METHRRFLTLYGTLMSLAAILFVVLGWHANSVRKTDAAFRVERERLAAQINALTDQRQQLDHFFMQPENAKLHGRAMFVNSIIDAQSFNWTQMFMDLEHILPGGVRVMSIEPKQVGGQAAVRLTVGATNEDAKRDFLNALEKSDVFSHVELSSVRAANRPSDIDQIILELTVFYSRT
jgi:type IV pilus assembly protein PilN